MEALFQTRKVIHVYLTMLDMVCGDQTCQKLFFREYQVELRTALGENKRV